MANACSNFPNTPKKPRVQHVQKEEKLPELKEIEDDEEEGVAWVSFGLDKDFEWETCFDAELSLSHNVRPCTCINFEQIYAYSSIVDHPLAHP